MEQSEAGRLVSTFTAPSATFRAIAERPTWVLALVVSLLLSAVATYLAFERVDPEAFLEQMRARSEQELPASVDGGQILGFAKIGAIVAVLLLGPLVTLATAGLFLLVFRLAGGTLDFRRSLAVVVHGFLPFALAALVGLPFLLSRERIDFTQIEGGGYLPTNVGFFAAPETSAALRALLTSCDLFSLWTIALLALGFSMVARVSRGTAWAGVGALWIVGVAIKVVLASFR